jgi:predicted PurR-regulated permease PerM
MTLASPGRTEPGRNPRAVPVRAIVTTILLVLATVALTTVVIQTRRVLTWMVIAAFFAIAVAPTVGWLERRLPWRRRSLATVVVFLVVFVALAALVTAFVIPLAQEGTQVAGQLPDLIDQARTGRGPVGDLLQRSHALEYAQHNEARIREFATGLTTPAAGVLRGVATGVVGTITIFVLAFLMVLEGPALVSGSLALFPAQTAQRMRAVGEDCARSITGYLSGNLLISVICGVLTYATLRITGVAFAGLISLFVAVADLIPLIGATLGAVVAGAAGFIHSVQTGIIVVVFFLLYQQLENHLLQPLVFSRTVKLNPLTVIIAILIAAELAGILGALLAIPAASMIQVIVRDLWDHRRGRLESEPTIGEEVTPVLPVPSTLDGRAHEQSDSG